jgi:hypothetical protein
MVNYFNPTVIAEWITFIAALFLLNKKTANWRYFIILLFLTLCVETLGWYMIVKLKKFDNALPFNILMLVSTIFFAWFLKSAISSIRIKSWINIVMALFLLLWLINLFFIQGFWRYNSFSEAVGDIILSILCCYFLFSLVKDINHINLLQLDYFWLANGILFYSLGSALLYQFSDILNNYRKQTNINIGNYINYALNIVLYTSLIIAFTCRRKATRLL